MEDQLRLDIDESAPSRARWDEVLKEAREYVGREAVESWLRDATPVSLEERLLTLAVPHLTAKTWIEKKYAKVLRLVLGEIHGVEMDLAVVVRKPERKPAPAPASGRAHKSVGTRTAPPAAMFAPIPLNDKYTFQNYVVGQSNRFAHAAASAVGERPGTGYNPLFIYGGVGLGKTHLLQAIGHALREREPRARVAYVSGETFTSHFVTSLREHREEEFRRAYRTIDIWLVDDIQFIADKTGTKEEFFHTFNELYLTNRQIVLASDRPPRELRLMEDRLRTRLESGLMVEIVAPEFETRIAILQQRAAMEGVEIPPEVLYHIARTVTTNIRVLEAALIRMLALASLNRCEITAELAGRSLGAFMQEGKLACISAAAIQRAVCEHFRVSDDDLVSARRDRPICLARQVAMYLIRELSRKSLAEIGQLFGGKAHSTVLYSCDKLEKEMKLDEALSSAVRRLRSQLAAEGSEG